MATVPVTTGPSLFDQFVDEMKDLPTKISTNFSQIRDLDEKVQKLQKQVDETLINRILMLQTKSLDGEQATAEGNPMIGDKTLPVDGSAADEHQKQNNHLVSPVAQRSSKRKAEHDMVTAEENIQQWTQECLAMAEEKVFLANEVHELVESHAKKLDKDLARYKSLMERSSKLKAPIAPKIQSKLQTAKRRKEKKSTYSTKKITSDPPPLMHIVTTNDPNEPTYCICNRVSFGDMIACDSGRCKIEWFHFECVGLTAETKPKTKWICPLCRGNSFFPKKKKGL